MEIEIGRHGWTQIAGDMNPGAHGGTIATADGNAIEIRQIQPTREYVGDDAAEIGFPFWTRDGYFDLDDLDPSREEVLSALQMYGQTPADLEEMTPTNRGLYIAEALLSYGRGDEGPAGWAQDVVPGRVKWWGAKRATGWRYLQDEDRDFRAWLREMN